MTCVHGDTVDPLSVSEGTASEQDLTFVKGHHLILVSELAHELVEELIFFLTLYL